MIHIRRALVLVPFVLSCSGSAQVRETEHATPMEEVVQTQETANGPPVAELRPVTHTYHGVDVVDPYEWLENPADPDVRAWSDGQNRHARSILSALPGREAIGARVREALENMPRSYRDLVVAGGKLFALENQPPREQPIVVVMDGTEDQANERILVDPTQLGSDVAIDWFRPSPDGRYVAVSLSRGGSERGDVRILEVANGNWLGDTIEHVNGGTAGGDLAWLPDGSGFYYTRYPRAGERPEADEDFYQQLYFHQLGAPVADDRYELGRDLPRIAEIQLELHGPSRRVLATVQNGDGGEFAIFLRAPDGAWTQLCDFDDRIVQATFGPRNDLYYVSRAEAPRGKLMRTTVARPDFARGTVVIPQGDDTIVTDFWGPPTVYPGRTKLYVTYQVGGPSELRVFDLRGRALARPEQAPVSAVQDLTPVEGDTILYRAESFVTPSAWFRYDGSATQATALREYDPNDPRFAEDRRPEVRREMATSRDGTQVPLNIIVPRGVALDGTAPCIVTGYGGYGSNYEPRYRPLNQIYLSRGAIFVVTNLRGGAEFGDEWHEGGRLTRKQNVFDDFHAALEYLIEHRYTSRERLGIIGGSNGGLLMGAMITQHPELVRTVVSFVGIYDMLRVELSPNGAFNVTEFGTVTNEEHFRALHAYSPLHNVRDGVAYPSILFLTGANDPRVEPWHSRKMTARLQAANGGDRPILLRTSDTSGHGMGTSLSEEIEEMTDVISFMFAELGIEI